MNITLINPKERGVSILRMSLLYVGTSLKREGHNVTILDSPRNVKLSTDMVGITATTSQVKEALRISDMIKAKDQDTPIVWGGIHPTLFPEQTLADRSVDYVIKGEAEYAIRKLKFPFPEKGIITQNTPTNLNEFSPPEWELFDMERYVQDFKLNGINYGKSLPIHSGRGCSSSCSFCINSVLGRPGWMPLSAKNIVNEIIILKKKYGIEYVKFVDENFFLDKKRVRDFCSMIIKYDIKWHALAKTTTVSSMDDKFIELVKRSGCEVISMGAESGFQRILNLLNKGTKVQDTIEAVVKCKRHGIRPICSFMTGIPTETKQERKMTAKLINKIRKICPSAVTIGPQPYRPYPGTELYARFPPKKEPKSLREWANAKKVLGYIATRNLPIMERAKNIASKVAKGGLRVWN